MTAVDYAHIQEKRGTAATWTADNPVLLQGEVGFETDTGKKKTGDGSTAWNSLGYDYLTPSEVSAAYASATQASLPRLAQRTNLVENHFFSADLSGWTVAGVDGNHTIARVAGTGYVIGTDIPDAGMSITSGGSFLEMTATAATNTHSVSSPVIPVNTAKSYRASVWARAFSGSPVCYLNVACLDASGVTLANLRLINGATLAGWTKYTLSIAPADFPAGTVAVQLVVYGNYGTISVADFTMFRFSRADLLNTATPSAEGAHEIHLDSTGSAVWMGNLNAGTVAKFGLDGVRTAETTVTGMSYFHDMSDDGTYLWIVDYTGNKLYKVQLSNAAYVSASAVPAPSTHAYGVHCFGGYVWVGAGDGANSRLHRYDPGGNTWTSYNIGLHVATNNVSICDDGTYLWVSSQSDNAVIKVNPATGAVVTTVAVPFSPYGVGSDGTYVYAGGAGTLLGTIPNRRSGVCRITAATGAVETVKTVSTPAETNWKYDGRRFMYAFGSPDVGAPSVSALLRWDTRSNLLESLTLPGEGRFKAVEPVNGEVWAVSYYAADWLRFAGA